MQDHLKRLLIIAGAFYLRNSPIEKGRYKLINILLPWIRILGTCMGRKIVRTRYGFQFHADLADWLGQYVYLTGTYERPTSDIFVKLIKPGDTFLDVGANAGYFSLLCANLSGPTGRVMAFEPIPSVRDGLLAQIALNKLKNVEVVPKAVSDATAKLKIYEGPLGHKGISSLRPLASASQELIIDAIRLDDLAQDLRRIDCIKIDVEGAEMRALIGMKNLIERFHPYLIIEFTDSYLNSFGNSAEEMANWLISCRYQLYRIEEDGLYKLDLTDTSLPAQYNVLATELPHPSLI